MDVVEPLLPVRHPNRDFFLLDIADAAPRGDMAAMEYPFFALGTQPDTREREYRRGDVVLRVIPSIRGMATVFDRDVLLYCISQLMARKNAGLPIGKTVRFSARDMLMATNRTTDGESYKRLEQAVVRLGGTRFLNDGQNGGAIGKQNLRHDRKRRRDPQGYRFGSHGRRGSCAVGLPVSRHREQPSVAYP